MTSDTKYLPADEVGKAVAEFFGGDTGKAHAVMVLAAQACEGPDDRIYLPKNPYGRRKKIHPTPFDRFKASLASIGEEGVIPFLCERFALRRFKVAKAVAGQRKVALTAGDDARVTAEVEKRLKRAVGSAFPLAREQLIRLIPMLPADESGQMVIYAMDLVVANHQINQIDEFISRSYEPDDDGKAGRGPSEKIMKQKKELSLHRDRMMKTLGLTSEDIIKRGGPKGGSLASAAEALKATVAGMTATADLMAEARGINLPEEKTEKLDEIDLAFIREPAKIGEESGTQ